MKQTSSISITKNDVKVSKIFVSGKCLLLLKGFFGRLNIARKEFHFLTFFNQAEQQNIEKLRLLEPRHFSNKIWLSFSTDIYFLRLVKHGS